MAEYLTLGGEDAWVAMALYAVSFLGMGLSFGAIFEWMLRSDRPPPSGATSGRRAARLRFSIGSLLYLVAIPVGAEPTSGVGDYLRRSRLLLRDTPVAGSAADAPR